MFFFGEYRVSLTGWPSLLSQVDKALYWKILVSRSIWMNYWRMSCLKLPENSQYRSKVEQDLLKP